MNEKYCLDKGRAELIESVRKTNPFIVSVITRAKNKNVIVFEVIPSLSSSEKIEKIHAYWLLLEKSYYEEAFSKNLTEKEELSLLDYTAWGYTVSKTNHENTVRFKMNKIPNIEFIVKLTKNKAIACYRSLNGEMRKVESVHVQDISLVGLPIKVDYVDVFYRNKDNELLSDRLI
jgi:hypothetical protein